VGIEKLDDAGEVGQRPGQPIDLVDDNDVNETATNIMQVNRPGFPGE
jgi:hypothetical protein